MGPRNTLHNLIIYKGCVVVAFFCVALLFQSCCFLMDPNLSLFDVLQLDHRIWSALGFDFRCAVAFIDHLKSFRTVGERPLWLHDPHPNFHPNPNPNPIVGVPPQSSHAPYLRSADFHRRPWVRVRVMVGLELGLW